MMQASELAYGFGKRTALPYGDALDGVKAALKDQGFGVLTEIDVRQTMKDKLGIDFRPYVILGACNPPLAERALAAELDIGLLLPCNVVVYEDSGGAIIKIMDPEAALGLVGNPSLEPVAREAKERLLKALEAIPAS